MSLLETISQGTAAPPEEAHALPFGAYSDREVFEMELEQIFRRDWIALCPAASLSAPGDFLALDLAGEPIVVLRGDDGELRALSNVCRHRGTPICDVGAGNAARLVCPYHAWTYDQQGRLKSWPYPGNVEIDASAHCLPQFRLELWNGVVFVNLDPDATPLSERLVGIDRHLQKFQIDRYEESPPATGYTTWDSNWKLAFENGIESYHLFNVHTKTLEPGSPTRDAFYVEGGASWTITAGTLHPGRKAKPWDPPTIGAFENENYTLVSIPPSLVGILTPDSWGWLSVLPLAPDRCLIGGGATRPRRPPKPEKAAGKTKKPKKKDDDGTSLFEAFMEEDRWICERNQRGMATRYGDGGKLVEIERVIVDFHSYLGWRLFEQKCRPPWRAPEAP